MERDIADVSLQKLNGKQSSPSPNHSYVRNNTGKNVHIIKFRHLNRNISQVLPSKKFEKLPQCNAIN